LNFVLIINITLPAHSRALLPSGNPLIRACPEIYVSYRYCLLYHKSEANATIYFPDFRAAVLMLEIALKKMYHTKG